MNMCVMVGVWRRRTPIDQLADTLQHMRYLFIN